MNHFFHPFHVALVAPLAATHLAGPDYFDDNDAHQAQVYPIPATAINGPLSVSIVDHDSPLYWSVGSRRLIFIYLGPTVPRPAMFLVPRVPQYNVMLTKSRDAVLLYISWNWPFVRRLCQIRGRLHLEGSAAGKRSLTSTTLYACAACMMQHLIEAILFARSHVSF